MTQVSTRPDTDSGESSCQSLAETYSAIHVGEQAIGGIMKTPTEAGDHPPEWYSYVTVDDMDRTIATASSKGGRGTE